MCVWFFSGDSSPLFALPLKSSAALLENVEIIYLLYGNRENMWKHINRVTEYREKKQNIGWPCLALDGQPIFRFCFETVCIHCTFTCTHCNRLMLRKRFVLKKYGMIYRVLSSLIVDYKYTRKFKEIPIHLLHFCDSQIPRNMFFFSIVVSCVCITNVQEMKLKIVYSSMLISLMIVICICKMLLIPPATAALCTSSGCFVCVPAHCFFPLHAIGYFVISKHICLSRSRTLVVLYCYCCLHLVAWIRTLTLTLNTI